MEGCLKDNSKHTSGLKDENIMLRY
jgi:hypothetical protein